MNLIIMIVYYNYDLIERTLQTFDNLQNTDIF